MADLSRFTPDPAEMPNLRSTRGSLPLRAVTIRAEVAGTTVQLEVTQTFENPYEETVEVSYVYPLPELAAVTKCELITGGRTIAARLRERGEAREAYADALEAGRPAALVEQERQGVFTTTLGNLAPLERAEVRFALAYTLPREDGRMVLRLPLVVGERYVPGAPTAEHPVGHGVEHDTADAKDASRITPPRLAPAAERPTLAIEVAITHGELGISDVESNLDTESTTTDGMTVVRLCTAAALDRDFVLRFRLGDDAIRTQLLLASDDRGGTFQLVLVPPVSPIRKRPRDLVLLVDRSGSMAGWKIVAARRAIARMIDELDTGDRFAVYAFGSNTIASPDLAHDQLHVASHHARARAIEFVTGLSAEGGTEMAQPIGLAVDLLTGGGSGRERWLVLVTDGQVANEDELVSAVARSAGFRVLAVGIDEAVNAALLARLARATGGLVELVHDQADLEAALDRLHLLIASPALECVTLEDDELQIDRASIVPPGPLHAFPGTPLIVRGRYRGHGRAIRVRARHENAAFELVVAGESTVNPGLRACWARAQLLALEDRFVAEPAARAKLHDRIIATSLEHGVACRFTAFVAIDSHHSAIAMAERHVQQPVEPSACTLAPEPPPIAARSTVGVSRFGGTGPSQVLKTQSGTTKGHFDYLSPEQIRGQPVDERLEVFGLGTLLWELVTGTRLWKRVGDMETAQAIVQGNVPPLLAHFTQLDAVIRRALSVTPADRFDGPAAFASALEHVGLAVAMPHDIAAWLQMVAFDALMHGEALLARVSHAIVPPHGYSVIARLGASRDSDLLLAARSSPTGNVGVMLRRAYPHVLVDPERLECFLDEAVVPLPGFVRTIEAGTDTHGGAFLAQDYLVGCDLASLQRSLGRAMPTEIALGIVVQAAKAASAALTLPDPSGATVGVLLRDLRPSSLRIVADGQVVWTRLGCAPSPHYAASRRTKVALQVAPGILDRLPSTSPQPAVSRFVVVPLRRPTNQLVGWWRRAGQFWRS